VSVLCSLVHYYLVHYLQAYSGIMSAKVTVQKVDLLALEQQVCFALAIANRAMLTACRPLPKSLRLTHPRYLVMHAPTASPEIQPGAVVRQADSRCAAAGFGHTAADAEAPRGAGPITRSRGTTDERTAQVELTADGFAP
jgi:MarR family transcriptional regulator, organic hydroperoxide resistance regulator